MKKQGLSNTHNPVVGAQWTQHNPDSASVNSKDTEKESPNPPNDPKLQDDQQQQQRPKEDPEAGSLQGDANLNSTTPPQLNATDSALDDIQPLPLPTLDRQARQRAQVPGAFASSATGPPIALATMDSNHTANHNGPEANSDLTVSTTDHSHSGRQQTENMPDNSGLAVANPVPDDEEEGRPHRLPKAEDFDEDDAARRREQRARRFRTRSLFGVLVVVAIIIVLVAVLVPKRGQKMEITTTEAPSSSPSQAPTSLDHYLVSLLPPDTLQALKDSESPQSKALEWLLKDTDNLDFYSNDRIRQRFALATLYYASNGDSWTINSNWLDYGVHECDWWLASSFAMKASISLEYVDYLSEFFPDTEPAPTICNSRGIYQHLWLDQNNLVGTLPNEIFLLTSLETLSFARNAIRGTIPTHLGQLTKLQGLCSMFQQEGGVIPTQIGLLTDLKGLLLNNNGHTGTVPTELWKLTKLVTLSVARNPTHGGSIPTEIGTFPQLRWLDMDDCGITGTIPSEIGKVQTLSWIALFKNRMSGPLPSELGNLHNGLWFLSLSENSFEGSIPSELGLLSGLGLLSLNDNLLSGQVPTELGQLAGMYITLSLQNNQLSGSLPSELGLFSWLYELDLSENQITGPIPSEMGQLKFTGHLNLASNALSGTIPLELSNLQQSLHTFRLDRNPLLSGVVPEALCHVNGTCVADGLNACEGFLGFGFDCTDLLCGCGCNCTSGQ